LRSGHELKLRKKGRKRDRGRIAPLFGRGVKRKTVGVSPEGVDLKKRNKHGGAWERTLNDHRPSRQKS